MRFQISSGLHDSLNLRAIVIHTGKQSKASFIPPPACMNWIRFYEMYNISLITLEDLSTGFQTVLNAKDASVLYVVHSVHISLLFNKQYNYDINNI